MADNSELSFRDSWSINTSHRYVNLGGYKQYNYINDELFFSGSEYTGSLSGFSIGGIGGLTGTSYFVGVGWLSTVQLHGHYG